MKFKILLLLSLLGGGFYLKKKYWLLFEDSFEQYINHFARNDGLITEKSIVDACINKWNLSPNAARSLAYNIISHCRKIGIPLSKSGFYANDIYKQLMNPFETHFFLTTDDGLEIDRQKIKALEKYALEVGYKKIITQSLLNQFLNDWYRLQSTWNTPRLLNDELFLLTYSCRYNKSVFKNTATHSVQMESGFAVHELVSFLSESLGPKLEKERARIWAEIEEDQKRKEKRLQLENEVEQRLLQRSRMALLSGKTPQTLAEIAVEMDAFQRTGIMPDFDTQPPSQKKTNTKLHKSKQRKSTPDNLQTETITVSPPDLFSSALSAPQNPLLEHQKATYTYDASMELTCPNPMISNILLLLQCCAIITAPPKPLIIETPEMKPSLSKIAYSPSIFSQQSGVKVPPTPQESLTKELQKREKAGERAQQRRAKRG